VFVGADAHYPNPITGTTTTMTPTRSDDDNSNGNGGKIGGNNVDGKIDDGPTYTTTLRSPHEGFAQPAPPLYSPEQEAYLHSVQHDAANLFPQGKVFSSLPGVER
jgi:hypothetical protein